MLSVDWINSDFDFIKCEYVARLKEKGDRCTAGINILFKCFEAK